MTLLVSALFALVCMLSIALAVAAQWRSIHRIVDSLAELPPDRYLNFHRENSDRETASENRGRVSTMNGVDARSARRLRRERRVFRRSGKNWAWKFAAVKNPCARCQFALGERR